MISQYRREYAIISFLTLFAVLLRTPSIRAAEDAANIIPDYSSYVEVDFLRVSVGTVRAKKLGEKGWYIAIETPTTTAPSRVTLTAANWKCMRFLPLRGGRGRLSQPGDAIELLLPANGVGWFLLLNPFPDVSVQDYRPDTLFKLTNNTPRRAKYPVVDIHAHLRNSTAEQRLKVMNEVGVIIVIDSPLGIPTERSYERFASKHPDRFLTFAHLNFSKRFEDAFPDEVVAKLRADVDRMNVIGISEVTDKGSGLYGNALVHERRGVVHVDDSRMMALWRAAARLKLPVLMHVAKPIWFYHPIDENHEFYQWQSKSFRWNLSGTDVLSRDEMLKRRDHIMDKVPDPIVIGAHMGHLEDDWVMRWTSIPIFMPRWGCDTFT